jgi:cyclic dehypoxanthinyl futalosine synthase
MGISREQALDCFRSNDLVGIGMEADMVRRRLHPEGVVSYFLSRSIAVDCAAAQEDLLASACEKIDDAIEMGATGVRILSETDHCALAGAERLSGLERLSELERLFQGVRRRFSALWIEGLSAGEISALARSCGLGLPELLTRLRGAGMDSIAGEVAAVDFQEWLGVHGAAHRLGMQTAAAMVFAAGETPEQRVGCLDAVRQLQQETGGFTAFVPVAAEAPGGRELDGATAVERLKMLAISRMFLETIENVQSTRAGQGLKVLQTGLRFGANDVGAVDAGAANGGAEEDLRRIIRDAGFRPVQRDALYRTMFLN